MSLESIKKNYDNVTEWASEANHSGARCLCLISMDPKGTMIIGTIPGMGAKELAEYLEHCVKLLRNAKPEKKSFITNT